MHLLIIFQALLHQTSKSLLRRPLIQPQQGQIFRKILSQGPHLFLQDFFFQHQTLHILAGITTVFRHASIDFLDDQPTFKNQMVGKIQNLTDSLLGEASNLGLNLKEQLGRGHGIRNSRVGLFQVQVQVLCQIAEAVFLQGWKKELGQLHRIHPGCVEVKTLEK